MAHFYGLWKGKLSILDDLNVRLEEASQAAPTEHESAVRIQRLFRGQFIRSMVTRQRTAAIQVLRVYRGHRSRTEARVKAASVTKFREDAVFHYHAIIVQRSFRGYYSRTYYHDSRARKRYINSIEQRGEELRATLKQYHASQLQEAADRAEDEARAEFIQVTQNLHHLTSTAAVSGIYNSPYADPPTANGIPIEDHLRAGVKDLLRTRGYTKRGLVPDMAGGKRVPVRPGASRLSIQASSKYEAVEDAEKLEKKLSRLSYSGPRDFRAGQRVPMPPYRRGINDGATFADPWKNPYLVRGIPKSQAELSQGRTSMGKAPAVHFHTSVGGNKSAVLPNDRFDVILEAEFSGGVSQRHKHTTARFGVPDSCDVREEDDRLPPIGALPETILPQLPETVTPTPSMGFSR